MASQAYYDWLNDGSPWKPAVPIDDFATTLRDHGYTVYVLGDDSHQEADTPEDHTAFSATGWPVRSPYGWIHACDIMPPSPGSGLPTLAQLGAQIVADRQNGVPGAAWVKYLNWEPGDGNCWQDSWQPDHERWGSDDRGHIHVSARSDCTHSTVAAGYDPVARIRGEADDMTPAEHDTLAATDRRVRAALLKGQAVIDDVPGEGKAQPVWIVATLNDIVARLATLESRPVASVTMTDADRADLANRIAGLIGHVPSASETAADVAERIANG